MARLRVLSRWIRDQAAARSSRDRRLLSLLVFVLALSLVLFGLGHTLPGAAHPTSPLAGQTVSTSTGASSSDRTLPPLDVLLAQTRLPTGYGWSPPAQQHQTEQVDRLWKCTQQGVNCTHDGTEANVVLLGANEFRIGWDGWTGGETVWASSVFRTMNALGYTTLLAADLNQTTAVYGLFAPWIKVVIISGSDSYECFNSAACIKQDRQDDLRIPAWKIFSFHFWAESNNPLGPRWTLSPEANHTAVEPNFDLGYSIETVCSQEPLTLHSDRVSQAYLYAKHSKFFSNENYAWSDDILSLTSSALNFSFVGAPLDDALDLYTPTHTPTHLPPALHLLNNPESGLLSRADFFRELGRSVALVGVGDPPLSPTPYDALCRGTPFLNPILHHSASDPSNRTFWKAQQPTLQWLDPPYVYNVLRGDQKGFEDALRRARDEPFEGRFIVPRMRESEMRKRVIALVEGDWKSEAEELLDRRKKGELQGELFVI